MKKTVVKYSIIYAIIAVLVALGYYIQPWAICFNLTNLIIGTIAISLGFLFNMAYEYITDEFDYNKYWYIKPIISIILILLIVILGFASSAMFNADTYANAAKIIIKTEEDVINDLPSIEKINQISLMDTASAKKLGDRTLGSMKELVSQYEVSEDYYTISYNGTIIKIAPLEYGGVFKAFNHETIPGYVTINVHDNTAKYNKSNTGIVYSPSDYFSQDLERKVQTKYPTTLLGNYSFQLDDEGNEYWVYQTMQYNTLMGCKVPSGCIIVSVDGTNIQKYNIENAPEWVDLIFDGEYVSTLYNWHGRYINGFWNFAKEGQTMVTDDYGYIVIDNTLYIYTGVTSVGKDESNIGFLLCNTRNGEMSYYPISGTEEYSAMSAAEGVVQNFGYKASFPSIVLVENVATYVMVLKDDNGLIKNYAMVNYENYAIAVVGNTIKECQEKYLKELNKENSFIDESNVSSKEIIVKDIIYIANGGETTVYIYSENDEVFKTEFNEFWLLQKSGTTIAIKYVDTTPIKTITNFE